jgi:hypothetical protein
MKMVKTDRGQMKLKIQIILSFIKSERFFEKKSVDKILNLSLLSKPLNSGTMVPQHSLE